MGKRIVHFIIILSCYMIAFSSCKKEEDLSDILTSKPWKRGIVDLNTSTNPLGDHSYYPIADCDTDDEYTFHKDGVLVIERGEHKCEQDEIQTETLQYSIDRENDELIIDGTTYILAEESEDQIKYYMIVPNGTNFANSVIFLLQ